MSGFGSKTSEKGQYVFRCGKCFQSFQNADFCHQHMLDNCKNSGIAETETNDGGRNESAEKITSSVHAKTSSSGKRLCKTISSARDVRNSKQDAKNTKAIQCMYCERVLSKQSLLAVHMRTHTNERPYNCDLCIKSFKRKSHLTQHRHLHTGVRQYKCYKCTASYADKCNLNRHNKLCHLQHNTRTRNFRSRSARTSILDSVISPPKRSVDCSTLNVVCPDGDVKSEDPSRNTDSEPDDLKDESFPSNATHSEFRDIPSLVCTSQPSNPSPSIDVDGPQVVSYSPGRDGPPNQEITVEESPDVIICVIDDTCVVLETGEDKSTTDITVEMETRNPINENLDVLGENVISSCHSQSPVKSDRELALDDKNECTASEEQEPELELDSGQTGGSCDAGTDDDCGEKVKYADVILYQCYNCDKTFKSEGALKYHHRKHTGQGVISCKVCKKEFFKPSLFKVHMRSHTGERPYTCSVCDKSYRDIPQLRDHQKLHTGDNLFPCRVCQKVFVKQAGLDVHYRTHVDSKQYKCEVCSRSFNTRQHLERHTRCHTGEKPYPCALCHLRFGDTSNRKKHMLRQHKDEVKTTVN